MTPSPLLTWVWVKMCASAQHQRCFHFQRTFWFLLPASRLTLDRRKLVSDTGGNVSSYTAKAICVRPRLKRPKNAFCWYLLKSTVTRRPAPYDTYLRCHLTQIKESLDCSEGQMLVYSIWQHFYKPVAWQDPGTQESNGSNLLELIYHLVLLFREKAGLYSQVVAVTFLDLLKDLFKGKNRAGEMIKGMKRCVCPD